ncbi:M14 family metallopeptidase [Candidatus Oscillochloris fontis]|uniref:M14 family metallopeptidase n=1 Tax=Candidatus Oscillochloris fontis TaxID=2496868 RepID=UPI00101B831C|nr:M14 family metallopeptidase [Candidatus Oscillochloris fontis]
MNFLLIFTLILSTLFSPTAQAVPPIREFTLGYSAQGRPIDVVQVGDGPRKLVVVGATHGAPEANTYRLTLELIDYFRANPQAVPTSVRLYFIPVLNPDGLALGTRFDGLGVDLNRNMNTNLDGCAENDWSITVQGARGIVSDTGGPYPDSQVESRLIRAFLLDAAGVIFIHSNAGLVFPSFCEHAPSLAMAETYALAANYTYSRYWPNYNITGSMTDWAGSMGIAAITPELITGDQSEFPQNLAGLQAVLANAEALLPPPADNEIDGIPVPAAIYRYWRAMGGSEHFGMPLTSAYSVGEDLLQPFTKVVLVQRASYADTSYYVQPAPLGQEAAQSVAFAGGDAFGPGDPASNPLFFEQTGHGLKLAFLDFWQRGGGLDVFGLPLSEEFTARAADGQLREMQYFERAVMAYYPEDGGVRLEPLGVRYQHLATLQQPLVAQMAR